MKNSLPNDNLHILMSSGVSDKYQITRNHESKVTSLRRPIGGHTISYSGNHFIFYASVIHPNPSDEIAN